MIGILDCRHSSQELSSSNGPIERLVLGGQTMLEHAIVRMAAEGVEHCVVVTGSMLWMEEFLASAGPFGCHLDICKPERLTGMLTALGDETVMVGRPDNIPFLAGNRRAIRGNAPETLYFSERELKNGFRSAFTGWAVSTGSNLLRTCFATEGASGLLRQLEPGELNSRVRVCATADSATSTSFLESMQRLLAGVSDKQIAQAERMLPTIFPEESEETHLGRRSPLRESNDSCGTSETPERETRMLVGAALWQMMLAANS